VQCGQIEQRDDWNLASDMKSTIKHEITINATMQIDNDDKQSILIASFVVDTPFILDNLSTIRLDASSFMADMCSGLRQIADAIQSTHFDDNHNDEDDDNDDDQSSLRSSSSTDCRCRLQSQSLCQSLLWIVVAIVIVIVVVTVNDNEHNDRNELKSNQKSKRNRKWNRFCSDSKRSFDLKTFYPTWGYSPDDLPYAYLPRGPGGQTPKKTGAERILAGCDRASGEIPPSNH
jgi:hypothetical protein